MTLEDVYTVYCLKHPDGPLGPNSKHHRPAADVRSGVDSSSTDLPSPLGEYNASLAEAEVGGPYPASLEGHTSTSIVTYVHWLNAARAAAAEHEKRAQGMAKYQAVQACKKEAHYVHALNAFAFGVLDAFSELVRARYAPACGQAGKAVPIRPSAHLHANLTYCKQLLPCQTDEESACQDLKGEASTWLDVADSRTPPELTHCCCKAPLVRPAYAVGPLLPFIAPPAEYELPFRSCSAGRLTEFEHLAMTVPVSPADAK